MSERWEAVIGLEIHAHLRTRTKIFCGCPTGFGAAPNTQTCPVCGGHPGVLPVLNRRVVELALRAALATGCRVPERSIFARKNYFYPDLPKGYQVSQYEEPLAVAGHLEYESGGELKRCRLTRIHLEEDAGKLIHGENLGDPGSSFVDLNRAGVPLIEIVTEPDLRLPEEARDFMAAMRQLLLHLGVCDGNMEEGSLRCDANVSVRPTGQERLGTKAEVKNMNSFRHVQKALEHEIGRQTGMLEAGERVVQETRLWDPDRGMTFSMRGKEEAHDYRYFPEPDLVPLMIDEAWLGRVRSILPELPRARRERYVADLGLPSVDAAILTETPALAAFFEETVGQGAPPRKAANWIITELTALLREQGRGIEDTVLTPSSLAGLLALVEGGTISGKMAKEVFAAMVESGRPPAEIVAERGMAQVSDSSAVEQVVDEVLAAHPAEVAAFRAGKDKLFGFFVGQMMRRSGGSVNPALANEILRRKLSG